MPTISVGMSPDLREGAPSWSQIRVGRDIEASQTKR